MNDVFATEGWTAFNRVSKALHDIDINISDLNSEVSQTRSFCEDALRRADFIRALASKRLLKPAPEVFWRVDRDLDEYRTRLGVDVRSLVSRLTDFHSLTTILELGGGSGRTAEQLVSHFGPQILLLSLIDEIYFPLRPALKAILRQTVHSISLTSDEFESVVDWLYKVMSLKIGTTQNDILEYDHSINERLAIDAGNLFSILRELTPKLSASFSVPSEIGIQPWSTDQQRYPNKISFNAMSQRSQDYIELLRLDPEACLFSPLSVDIYRHLNIYPPGMILGDFSLTANLALESVTLAMSVRGTTYLKDNPQNSVYAYSNVILAIARALQRDGVCIDDGVRENFGKRYRLPELMRIDAMLGSGDRPEIWIIVGPGVTGDDHNQQTAIRSVVLTKSKRTLDSVQRSLSPAYQLWPLPGILGDRTYLNSLDPDGRTYLEVTNARNSLQASPDYRC